MTRVRNRTPSFSVFVPIIFVLESFVDVTEFVADEETIERSRGHFGILFAGAQTETSGTYLSEVSVKQTPDLEDISLPSR